MAVFSYVCLMALCLVHVTNIEGRALKPHTLTIPPEGITFEISIKPDSNHKHPGQMKMEVAVKEIVPPIGSRSGPPNKPLPPFKHPLPHSKIVPTIEDRNGFRSGTCPIGYVKRGGFCFPDTDYD